jgi:tetratricopeptide (TPR) repeat protein
LDTNNQKFIYQPVSLVVDDSGRIYVVALSVIMGIIQLSSDGLYEGFVGAQKVSYNPVEYVWKQLMTDQQNARVKSFVPTEFNNVAIDAKGFIYATTSAINPADLQADISNPSKTPQVSAIKRLNPSGEDVLHRNGGISISGDLQFDYVDGGKNGQSVITDVALGDSKTYTLLDKNRSRYFTYSYEGDMLFAYGVYGNQSGTTLSPSAIAYKGTDFLVLDSAAAKITVYKRTHYGELIYKALDDYNNFRYDDAVSVWKETLKINSNLNLAYLGIGQSLAKQKKLEQAMEYFRVIDDKTNYSSTYKEYRQVIFEKYFGYIIIIIFLLLFFIVRAFRKIKKINRDEKYKPKRNKLLNSILYSYYLIFHPFDGFWDLKNEKRGNAKSGTIIMFMAILTVIINRFFIGYLFTSKVDADLRNFVLIYGISGIIVPVLLWTLANWCLTTLMDGEGSLKDIYTATTYSLLPIVLLILPVTFFSHFMIQDELTFITFFTSLAYIWAIALIIIGSMVTHQYSFSKNFLTSILSVVGIGVIMFLILLVLTIMQRMWVFVDMIYKELSFRL